MKNFLYISILMFVFTACQDVKYPEPPENLLSKEKFVQVLADAYIGNASRSKSVNNRILRSKGIQLDSLLYSKHQVDSLSVIQSNSYYASNLEEYTEIILEVEKLLTARKEAMDSLLKKKQTNDKAQDSAGHTSFKKPEGGQLTEPAKDEGEG